MGLKELKEELKGQLAEAEKREGEDAPHETIEQPVEEVKETPVEEKPEVKEDPKDEVKAEEPKKTPADYARERREKLKREERLSDELAAANARIAELTRPRDEPKQIERDPEPNKTDDPEAWREWDTRQARKEAQAAREEAKAAREDVRAEKSIRQNQNLREAARNELLTFEQQARTQVEDYDDAKSFYASALALGIRAENPRITPQQLLDRVNEKIMVRASILLNEGYENPLIAMRDDAIALGYKKLPKQESEVEEKKPDLARVANNRARNAGTVAASGSAGRGELTKTALGGMTVAEYSKVPIAERRRILSQQ